jgi:aconitate hydratase
MIDTRDRLNLPTAASFTCFLMPRLPAERYRSDGVPRAVIAGLDYGSISSLDWEAKESRLRGVRAVFAGGFQLIHRSVLIGMGSLPCQFNEGIRARALDLNGGERLDLERDGDLCPRVEATLHVKNSMGQREAVPLLVRIDMPIEAAYYAAGSIIPHELEQVASASPGKEIGEVRVA